MLYIDNKREKNAEFPADMFRLGEKSPRASIFINLTETLSYRYLVLFIPTMSFFLVHVSCQERKNFASASTGTIVHFMRVDSTEVIRTPIFPANIIIVPWPDFGLSKVTTYFAIHIKNLQEISFGDDIIRSQSCHRR